MSVELKYKPDTEQLLKDLEEEWRLYRMMADSSRLSQTSITAMTRERELFQRCIKHIKENTSPEIKVYKIDVGNIPAGEVEAYMKDVVERLKKSPPIDPVAGDYNLKYNLMDMNEDIFIPMKHEDKHD